MHDLLGQSHRDDVKVMMVLTHGKSSESLEKRRVVHDISDAVRSFPTRVGF